jgi:dolichyl-phosphate-mannose-protein mannosyltransferase
MPRKVLEASKSNPPYKRVDVLVYVAFVLITSFFSYFYRYNFPASPFWDEPYHIAAAQKYMNGVFFMEPHPPLGKLLIALGEKITKSNSLEKNSAFLQTDYATSLGEGYSFTGYRLFPALLGWLTAPLLFFIFLWFTRNPALSTIFSFLYIFDNAQIVHSRGAMVDSPATFLGVAMILLFLHIQDSSNKNLWKLSILSSFFGIAFGLIMATKLVGLIFILLFPCVIYQLFPSTRKIVLFLSISVLSAIIAYVAVWHTHFSIAKTIVPELHTNGYYTSSEEYKSYLTTGTTSSLRHFGLMLRDSFAYMDQYEKGVPRLDLCKQDENGSPSYYWPFGARTINYRWEKSGDDMRYLYLQSNPVGWACGLIGIVLAAFLLLTRVFNPTKEKLQHGFLLLVFYGLYVGYMIAISLIPRVMYLYHYFIPLLLSYILFVLAIINIRYVGRWKVDENRRLLAMTFLAIAIFGAYQAYKPLTYYEPISGKSVERLSIVPLWELTCVGCTKVSPLVVPQQK